MKLSIIIPFYNVEKYIAECLDSVYAQDIHETEYEVICVNDCSPDASRDIVLGYQKKHSNLKLVEHEVNKMLGAARNTGLKAAKGEYVWFIDSDDYIEKNVLAKLLNQIYKNGLEILQFNCNKVNNENEVSNFQYFPNNTNSIKGIEYLKIDSHPYWDRLVTTWSKIFNREFLITNKLFFPNAVFYEDNVHTLKSLLLCEKFQYINNQIYYYRDNSNSIMNTNALGGIKLADKVRFEVECIAILEAWRINDNSIADFLIPMYTYHLKRRKKTILYFQSSELKKFYKRIENIDASKFKSHLNFKDYFIYLFPLTIKIINFVLMQPMRLVRNLKRKIFN